MIVLASGGIEVELAHGAEPGPVLAAHGLPGRWVSSERRGADLVLSYADGPAPIAPPPSSVPDDADLSQTDRASAVRVQRAAAYAVVVSPRGLLLTELSARTNAPGLWTLPGGGIDPGESPVEAVVREAHEETGQHLVDVVPLAVSTNHWVGRAPRGELQDFHAVRLVHRAHCPEPTPPVVHDVGGSTAAAAWVGLEELSSGRWPLVGWVPWALLVAGALR